MEREAGFTLLEMICILAIVALLAALILPALPRATSRPRLEAYALQAASILSADRNAAIRTKAAVATALNPNARTIRSGANGGSMQLPSDVAFDAVLARQCNGRSGGERIEFFPSGMSCGGTIGISRSGAGFQVRVNWLTGGVEVVALDLPAK